MTVDFVWEGPTLFQGSNYYRTDEAVDFVWEGPRLFQG